MITWALDNETFLITRERPAPPVVCVSSCVSTFPTEPELWHAKDIKTLAKLRAILLNPNVRIVGHNIAYDCITWAATWPELLPLIFAKYRAGLITDTGIRAQLVDIARGKTLKDDKLRAYSLFDLYKYVFKGEIMPGPGKGADSWRLRYGELIDVALADWPADAVDYAKCDAQATLRICMAQDAVGHLLQNDAALSYRAFCLMLTSFRGMRCDAKQVDALEREVQAELDELRPELMAAGLLLYEGPKKDPKRKLVKKTKPAQELMAAACKAAGIEPLLTDKGDDMKRAGGPIELKHLCLDKSACHHVGHPLLLRRAKYVGAEKIFSTYVPLLRAGVDSLVTTRFGLVATSRTGSSAPSANGPAVGGNFQNMPRRKGVRECFIPRDGLVYLAADFTGAELHKLAQTCLELVGFSVLGDVLNGGQNVHLYMGAQMLGISYDDAMARYKQGDPVVKEARQQAKAANFGFGGAMGWRKFIRVQLKEGVKWSEHDAKHLRLAWLKTFPEMQQYFDKCKAMLGPEGKGPIKYPDNGMTRKVRGLSMCANGFFQVGCAVGALDATNEVTRRCFTVPDSALYGARPVNFVHDELILEIKDDPAIYQPAAKEFEKVMSEEFNKVVTDFPTVAEPVLMTRWSKSAEPCFDSKGGLIPWQPRTWSHVS